MTRRGPIVEELFDVAGTKKKKLRLRIYAPEPFERTTFGCRVVLGSPFHRDGPVYGEGPLQALGLAIEMASTLLYSSELWRQGRLGWHGSVGGYLGVAAPTTYFDFAPYPFELRDGDEEPAPECAGADGPEEMILERPFAVYDPLHPFGVRIWRPRRDEAGRWRCRTEIDAPIAIRRYALGDGGLEALWRALCIVGRELYGHPLWRAGRLGCFDEPGGYLGIPAPNSLTILSPHPF